MVLCIFDNSTNTIKKPQICHICFSRSLSSNSEIKHVRTDWDFQSYLYSLYRTIILAYRPWKVNGQCPGTFNDLSDDITYFNRTEAERTVLSHWLSVFLLQIMFVLFLELRWVNKKRRKDLWRKTCLIIQSFHR